MHRLKTLASERSLRPCQRILDGTENQCEWRAKLVTDVAEKRGLSAVDFNQCFGAFSLFLVGSRVGQCSDYMADHQLEIATVVVIEGAARVDSEHQHPSRLLRARTRNWQKQRL